MPESVLIIKDKNEFKTQLAEASTGSGQANLVVVDFFATWCKPCTVIGPVFAELSEQYPNVRFLKVDVDRCEDIAMEYNVRSLPNFVFIRDGKVIDRLSGSQPQQLRAKLLEHTSSTSTKSVPDNVSQTSAQSSKKPQQTLPILSPVDCECLNESDSHPLTSLLKSDSPDAYLLSDTDAQLIIQVSFGQLVKIHSIQMNGPPDCGPKTVKLFINQTTTPDFTDCENNEPVQALVLEPSHLQDGGVIALNFVKFQRVNALTLFIQDNQEGTDVTRIDKLCFLGSPVNTTNMQNFKRVAGVAGEAHG